MFAQPFRGGTDLNALDVRGNVTRAKSRVFNMYRYIGIFRFELDIMPQRIRFHRQLQNSGEFFGDTTVRETVVPAVGGYFYIQDVIFDTLNFERVEGESFRK